MHFYEQYRPLLFSIAYRMLGLEQDAEDVVQDVFVALQQHYTGEITDMKAYLCKLVTNRCLNELKSSRKAKTTFLHRCHRFAPSVVFFDVQNKNKWEEPSNEQTACH
jgi:RNA polymerase sigma factor (sigma-70 family)